MLEWRLSAPDTGQLLGGRYAGDERNDLRNHIRKHAALSFVSFVCIKILHGSFEYVCRLRIELGSAS
jgi:hypothetical protein